MKIAQKRSKFRTSLQIVWITAWIESLPYHGIGPFDFISSTGVLHHLKSPQKGLNVFNDIQMDNGGAVISMYGRYGRSGIYHIQDLMREIRLRKDLMQNELHESKAILSILPQHHWFNAMKLWDITHFGDNGIYDLLLHKRDVSYTISSLFRFVSNSGYNVVGFSSAEVRLQTSLKFIINDEKLYELLTKLEIDEQIGIGELINGRVLLPELFISKQNSSEACINDENNVVFTQLRTTGITEINYNRRIGTTFRNQTFKFAKLSRIRNIGIKGQPLSRERKGVGIVGWPVTKFNNFVLNFLTRLPMRALRVTKLISEFNLNQKQNISTTQGQILTNNLFSYIKETGIFFVKNAKIPKFKLTCFADRFFEFNEKMLTFE